MSSKIINVVLVCFFSFCILNKANAELIVGELYADNAGIQWEYVGLYDLVPDNANYFKPTQKQIDKGASTEIEVLSGLEAAMLALNLSGDVSDYAISTKTFRANRAYKINHKAWYDQYDGRAVRKNEGYKNSEFPFYNADGAFSAYIKDRTPKNIKINYVFKSLTPSTTVPEPSTFAIFALGLLGLLARRVKQ